MLLRSARVALRLIALPALIMSVGCSGSNMPVSLRYEPTQRVGDVGADVMVIEFEDTRDVDDVRDLGNNRSLIGTNSGRVLTDEAPAAWVTDALVAELSRAGFQVTRAGSGDSPTSAPLVVSGELTKCSVSRKGTSGLGGAWSTTIRVHVIVTRDGSVVHEKSYSENEKEGSRASSVGEIERELNLTLSKLLQRVVSAIRSSVE